MKNKYIKIIVKNPAYWLIGISSIATFYMWHHSKLLMLYGAGSHWWGIFTYGFFNLDQQALISDCISAWILGSILLALKPDIPYLKNVIIFLLVWFLGSVLAGWIASLYLPGRIIIGLSGGLSFLTGLSLVLFACEPMSIAKRLLGLGLAAYVVMSFTVGVVPGSLIVHVCGIVWGLFITTVCVIAHRWKS